MNGPVKVCADQWNFVITDPLDQWLNFPNFYPWTISVSLLFSKKEKKLEKYISAEKNKLFNLLLSMHP